MREMGRILLPAAVAALAAGSARAEPALWEVTGGESTVWLFGSVHLLPEGGFTVGDELADALDDAERVCLEIDTGAEDEAATSAVTLARAIDPEGRDLFELLGSDADEVRAAAEDAGVPLEALAMFEPWFAGLTVSVMALQAHGYDVQHGVEQIIQAEARDAGMPDLRARDARRPARPARRPARHAAEGNPDAGDRGSGRASRP